MTHEEELRVNGSGLFFFKSALSYEKKIKILDWFDSLTKEQKEFVSILLSEAIDESHFFNPDPH